MAPFTSEKFIESLQTMIDQQAKTIDSQSQTITDMNTTIADLNTTIDGLRQTVANLEETIRELQRKLFGSSSEKTVTESETDDAVTGSEDQHVESEKGKTITVSGHERKTRSTRNELYKDLPAKRVEIPVPEDQRFCPDCGGALTFMCYKFVREELRITPAKVERIHYYQERLSCPICKEEDVTTIVGAKVPTALIKHSPASPSIVAYIIYEKYMMSLPFYRQQADWKLRGVPLSRAVMASWCITCALEYLEPVYKCLHRHLVTYQYLHADEVPCQVLKEEDRDPQSKSYMWIYLTGRYEEKQIILYEYQPGRKGEYPKEFLEGFQGYLHCDGYSAYNKVENVTLVCCLAHARRRFFEAIPSEKRKNTKLLDIDSEEQIQNYEDISVLIQQNKLPAEVCFAYCNKIFWLERQYKDLDPETRKQKREESERQVWENFWDYLETFECRGGSNLAKAVTYAKNHRETLMNYLQDGNCVVSNNAAERRAKSYVQGRKNFLFHDTVDGAKSSAILYSIIETAKANNLNIYQYLYTLLLYMPDHKDSPAGIEALMPWSDFIKERCMGVTGNETETPEKHGTLPI